MALIVPPHPAPGPAVHQRWRQASFLHWPADPARIGALLPDGLEPDLFGGSAWVGLTPFVVRDERFAGVPALPLVSSYRESNIRTYVMGPNGPGLWFLRIHVSSLVNVLAGRLLIGAPYERATVDIDVVSSATVHYRVDDHRTAEESDGSDVVVSATGHAPDRSALAAFLIDRWRAYSTHPLLGPMCIEVEHEPWHPVAAAAVWQRRPATIRRLGTDAAAEPLAHLSSGVDARLAFSAVRAEARVAAALGTGAM